MTQKHSGDQSSGHLAYLLFGSFVASAFSAVMYLGLKKQLRIDECLSNSDESECKDNFVGICDDPFSANAIDSFDSISPLNSPSTCSVISKDTSTAFLSSNGFYHPEGPNIGPASANNWLLKEGDLPPKTDILHKGHSKGGKLIIAMVGLPGRGKTYTARKVARYLRWINYRTRTYSLARYRIECCGAKQTADFFDNQNDEKVSLRLELMHKALDDMLHYLNHGGECAILDGTNFNKEKRAVIQRKVEEEDGYEILWVETLSDDPEIIQTYLHQLEESSPDFLNRKDFEERVEHYRDFYETLEFDEGSYVKIFDGGVKLEIHAAQGFVPTKITSFLMNLHVNIRPIYISRHGESMFNLRALIGGDPDLSPRGKLYAEALATFVEGCPDLPASELCVWSSTMKRARQTCKGIQCSRYVEWRALREIEVGVCDAMTYNQVKEKFPEEYTAREKDKLNYRYPRGESYLDIISRLEPVIFEMERQKAPLLIVAHQAVLRCLYAYFLDLPNEEVPYLSIPLHTVIKLTPQAFGCSEKRFKLMENIPDGQKKM